MSNGIDISALGKKYGEEVADRFKRCKDSGWETLDLSACNLTSLPSKVWEMEALEELFVRENPLPTLPGNVGNMMKLKKLNASGCQLASLPPDVWEMESLEELNVRGNPLSTFPKSVGKLKRLKRLKKLDVSRCKFISLPSEVGEMEALEELHAEMNPLIALPSSVGNLKNLKNLNVSQCRLTTLLDEIGSLANLEMLYVSGNPLQPIELRSMSGKQIISFLKERLQGRISTWHLRIILVGAKEKGKTSLVRYICTNKPTTPIPADERTFGVDITSTEHCFEVEKKGEKGLVMLEFWDFAGHTEFYSTQHLFLENRAIYFIVFSWCDEVDVMKEMIVDTRRRVRAAAPNALIFLVGMQKDKMKTDNLKRKMISLQNRLKDSSVHKDQQVLRDSDEYLKFFVVSSVLEGPKSGVPSLMDVLRRESEKLEWMGEKIPKWYFDNMESIGQYITFLKKKKEEEEGVDFNTMSFESVVATCYVSSPFMQLGEFTEKFCGVKDRGQLDVETMISFLHHYGTIQYNKKTGYVCLDPQWLYREVISPLHMIRAPNGRIQRKEVLDHWGYLPEKIRGDVPKILEGHELIYPVGEGKWLVPLMLPEWSIGDGEFYERLPENHRTFQLQVDYVPYGFYATFLYRLFKLDDRGCYRKDRVRICYGRGDDTEICWITFEESTIEIKSCPAGEWLAEMVVFKLQEMIRHVYSGLNLYVLAQFKGGDPKRIPFADVDEVKNTEKSIKIDGLPFKYSDLLPNQKSQREADMRTALAGNRFHVFLSHAGEDKPFVFKLLRELRKEGVVCFMDTERSSIRACELSPSEIDKGVAESRIGLFVVTDHFVGKKWPEYEAQTFLHYHNCGEKLVYPAFLQFNMAEWEQRQHTCIRQVAKIAGRSINKRGDNISEDDFIAGIIEDVLSVLKRKGSDAKYVDTVGRTEL